MTSFGPHLIIDLWECSRDILMDMDFAYRFLRGMVEELGMTVITLPYAVKWKDKFADEEGISAFVMLAESHISVHTFPTQGYAFVDIFSCREFDYQRAEELIRKAFNAGRIKTMLAKRGEHFFTPLQAASRTMEQERREFITY